MATTDKSTKQENLNGQSATSTSSKTQASAENSSNPHITPGKLMYAQLSGWSGTKYFQLVQIVKLKPVGPLMFRDADVREWEYLTYGINEHSSHIPKIYVKAKDLYDRDFVEGEFFKCLT